MTAPRFRNGHILPVYPIRALIRGETHWTMPTGRQGFVVEDEDLILRWWGPRFGLDDLGRFRFLEWKHGTAGLDEAQSRTFGLISQELADSDRFDGYYLVQYDDPDHGPEATYWVNGWQLDSGGFRAWCLMPYSNIERLRWPLVDSLRGTR